MVNGELVPPVGSLWYSFWFKEMVSVKGCISKSYRIPTFNDLYWTPGGNPNLLPESSWTEELTIAIYKKWSKSKLEYSATGYNRNVKDMISWVPSASYWVPMNISEVWSRGVEHRFKYSLNYLDWKVILNVNVDYVRSTSKKTLVANDVAIGKQLIYVPAWFGGANVTVQKKHVYVTYAHQYTDLRFTSRDHVEWLPSFSIGNIAAGYTKTILKPTGNYAFNFYAKCNNVFNVQYQTVAWRPLPGINFQLGCTIAFDLEKNTTL
jgi:iron complex outermembrane receptor protein